MTSEPPEWWWNSEYNPGPASDILYIAGTGFPIGDCTREMMLGTTIENYKKEGIVVATGETVIQVHKTKQFEGVITAVRSDYRGYPVITVYFGDKFKDEELPGKGFYEVGSETDL